MFLAGQAYYFVSDPRRALDSLEMARLDTLPTAERKDALWRRFSAARELNLPELPAYLADFVASSDSSIDDRLRIASGEAQLAFQRGSYAGLWQTLSPLIREPSDDADPLISSGAMVNFCYVAIGRGDYVTAHALVDRVLRVCTKHHLEFADGFCTAVKAHAELGLGRFAKCQELTEELFVISTRHEDPYLAVEARILAARLNLSKGLFERVAPIESWRPADPDSFRIYLAQYQALHSLAAAAAGDGSTAGSSSEQALELAATIETVTITEWTTVVATLAVDEDAGRQNAIDVLKAQYQRDFLDSFVLAARAVPAILPLVASDPIAGAFASETLKRCDPQRASRVRRPGRPTLWLDEARTRGLGFDFGRLHERRNREASVH